jgi:biotin carboxyl carrier protein
MAPMSARDRMTVSGFSLSFAGERLSSDLVRVTSPITGVAIDVRGAEDNGVWELTSPGWAHAKRARVVSDGPRTWVLLDGRAYDCDVARGGRRATSAHASDAALRSPMPATVVRVAVGVGDAVTKDAVLVVLEAMKMELAIKAPHAGVVSRLGCAPGQLVGPDDLLVVVEPAP